MDFSIKRIKSKSKISNKATESIIMESEIKATVENVNDMIETLRKVRGDPYADAVMSVVKLINFAELLMTQLDLLSKAIDAVEEETGFKLNFETQQTFNGTSFVDRSKLLSALSAKAKEIISYQSSFGVTALAYTSLMKEIIKTEEQKETFLEVFQHRCDEIVKSMQIDIKMVSDKIAENPGVYIL